MRPTDQLLTAARQYSEHKKISERYLSDLIFSDNRSLLRVKNGGSITLRSFEKAMRWLDHHWPPELPWPDGVQKIQETTPTNRRAS